LSEEETRDTNVLPCDAEAMNVEIVQLLESTNEETGSTFRAKIPFDARDYHMDVSEVGALAQEANVQRLALNHLAPKPHTKRQVRAFFQDPVEASYAGQLFVGKDSMRIVISAP